METKIDSEVTKTPGTETFNTMYSESDSEKSLGSYEIKEQSEYIMHYGINTPPIKLSSPFFFFS